MNMKKIFACSIAALMLFSSVASAEMGFVYHNTLKKDVFDANTYPTQEEITARQPKIKAELEQIALADTTFDDDTKTLIELFGFTPYKITYTVSNLGKLYSGFDSNLKQARIIVNNVTVKIADFGANLFDTSVEMGDFAYAGETTSTHNSYTLNRDTVSNSLNAVTSSTTAGVGYTPAELGANGTFTFDGVICLKADADATIDTSKVSGSVTYQVGTGSTLNTWGNYNLTWGDAPVDAKLTLDITENDKFDNGYVWNAELTKGDYDIAAFKAVFTEDVTGATAEREIRDISELNKVMGSGSVKFDIGLKTTKTLKSATFTAIDANNDEATWSTPVAE